MTTMMEFPDAEAVFSTGLRSGGIDRVYSTIPNNPTFPLVTVRRIGGIPCVRQYLDSPSLQVDVWGANKGEAHDIAQQARRILHEMEGERHYDAFILGVEDTLGLTWLPDPDTNRDRYTFGVTGHLRKAPPGS